jgi:hypothetical protein
MIVFDNKIINVAANLLFKTTEHQIITRLMMPYDQRCKFFCVFRNLRANCDCDCEFPQSQRNRNRFLKKIAVAAQSQSIIAGKGGARDASANLFRLKYVTKKV